MKKLTLSEAISILRDARLVGPFTLKVKGMKFEPKLSASRLIQAIYSETHDLHNVEVQSQNGTGFHGLVFNIVDVDYRGDGYDQWINVVPLGFSEDQAQLWALAEALESLDEEGTLTCSEVLALNTESEDNVQTLARDAWIAAEFEAAASRKLERLTRSDADPSYTAWDAMLIDAMEADPVEFLRCDYGSATDYITQNHTY